MIRLRIGIDVDGTVYPWTEAVNAAVMERFPETPDPGEHQTWDYLKELLGSDERWRWLWSTEAASAVFGRLDLIYPGAAEAINGLAKHHDIHFVTHRNPNKSAIATAFWLNEWFPSFKGVHILDNSVPKHDCYDFDVFIEDKPETIYGFSSYAPGVTTLMPMRPWNADFAHAQGGPKHIFYTWDAVPTIVNEVATDVDSPIVL